MRLKRLLPAAVLIAGATLFLAGTALGAPTNDNFGLDTAAGSAIPHTADISIVIGKIIRQALAFIGVIFLLLMIYAGFTYMLARGDEKKISTAKGIITGAVIGMAIVALSYALTSFVVSQLTTATGGTSSGSTGAAPGSAQLNGACTADKDCATGLGCAVDTHTCRPNI